MGSIQLIYELKTPCWHAACRKATGTLQVKQVCQYVSQISQMHLLYVCVSLVCQFSSFQSHKHNGSSGTGFRK